jgi:hypothetical protein
VSDTQARLDVIRQRSAELEDEYWGQRDFRDERTCVSHLARAAAIVDAELERVTAENDRLRAALSSALANEAQWWKKAQAALSPTYGPVGSLDGKGGVGL